MTQKEMIDDVVRVYFEGGDWQGYLKELVREVKNGEIQTRSADEHTARQLAIEALEKQIPYKPTDIGYAYTREKIGTCKCGNDILEHQKYCEECGQRLDWEEARA